MARMYGRMEKRKAEHAKELIDTILEHGTSMDFICDVLEVFADENCTNPWSNDVYLIVANVMRMKHNARALHLTQTTAAVLRREAEVRS